MRKLCVLLLADDKPGHYHLAEGVIAAMARRRPVDVSRIEVRRHRVFPGRALAEALSSGLMSPAGVMRLAYGIRVEALGEADVIVSAGGDTIVPSAALAKAMGARNVFCGTLRRLPPEHFDLIISSYQSHAGLPRHLVSLKPNAMDPDAPERRRPQPPVFRHGYPVAAGLLVGGDSGLFRYAAAEWSRLIAFLRATHEAGGTRWLISTSRRTSSEAADAFAAFVAADPAVAEILDYRVAGPGTLPRLFARADAIVATEDSSTMISEAVSQRLAVVGVSPEQHSFKAEEAEYRALLKANDWCRFVPIAELTPERFRDALAEIHPMRENHLDRLADALAEHLPELALG
ncbi:MAG: ELM1/GtrOC1 family putative glycosyltransferase [Hyphomicrobiaceae bacterium]